MPGHPGARKPARLAIDDIVDWIIARTGSRLVVGAPLGLGKSNAVLNALYRRARNDPGVQLEIITALSLAPPRGGSPLQRAFIEPFAARFFGEDYPRLEYVDDQLAGRLPANVRITEFYFGSGSRLGNEHAQRHYISSNYTHVARDLMDRGVNVIVQMVAAGEVDGQPLLSLSCNPDVTLDLEHRLELNPDYEVLKVAQVHRDLPFLHGDALVPPDLFDVLVEPQAEHRLFALPRTPVGDADYCVGIHASALIADRGTLQIGIGGLSEALVHALLLRQQDNERYRRLLEDAGTEAARGTIDSLGGRGTFKAGIFGASEMFLDGFMHLYRAGILKRRAYRDLVLQHRADAGTLPERADGALIEELWEAGSLLAALDETELGRLQSLGVLHPGVRLEGGQIRAPDGTAIENDLVHPANREQLVAHCLAERLAVGALMEGAFFLGSTEFYQWLRELNDEERPAFRMASVRRINQLYGGNETLEIAQRRNARFINSCMMMTVTGAAVSDALVDHQVVSGVGGQYNFVAMAHALHEGRSILMLRSTRSAGGRVTSSILWDYPHATIPRHLRDIVVTEYGIANLRGRSDEECIMAMIEVADSAFQEDLARRAKAAGKLRRDYVVPDHARGNTPQRLAALLREYRSDGRFGEYPFGSDFDRVEQRLVRALKYLKGLTADRSRLLATVLRGSDHADPDALARMGLSQPSSWRERLHARLLRAALEHTAGTR